MAGEKKPTVFLIDDHMIVVEGIRTYLAEEDAFEIVGHAVDGLTGIREIRSLKPDIVVLDISMPAMNGVAAAYEIQKFLPSVKIVVYSMAAEEEHVLSLLNAGISGYVLKGEPLEFLVHAMKAAKKSKKYYSPEVADVIRRSRTTKPQKGRAVQGLAKLSLREIEIFPLLADGKSSRQIAEMLCISPKTVESHKYNIMDKLNASSLAELTKIAVKEKLIEI